jgi:hypothetical protein
MEIERLRRTPFCPHSPLPDDAADVLAALGLAGVAA